jgi:signal transduction histidine kinase/FixJ family two-component response regulator
MPTLHQSSDLSREAWRSVAHHSRSGLLGFPLIFSVLGISILGGHAPGWFIALMGLVLFLTGIRAWLVFRFDALFTAAPRFWCWAYMADLTALIGLLTLVIVHIVAVAGLAPPGFLALTAAAATAGFGVIVYSYQMAVARFVIALVTLPPLVVLVNAPELADWPKSSLAGLGLIAYVLYLLAVTRQLHVERWEGLRTRQLMVARATDLEEAQTELRHIHRGLERKAAELRLAKEAAEQADRAKTQFLANMSHEIRTPLAGVIGLSDLMLKSRLEGPQRDYASLIQSSSEGLLRLIDDILDLSKVEAGMLIYERVPFELRALLSELVGLLRFRAREKGIALETAVADGVPEWVEGDPARLRQVLLNLVGNAIKFTEHGRVELSVAAERGNGPHDRSRTEKGINRLVFRVRDTGIGIPQEAHGRIFSLFSQADNSTSRRFGGTGLGLAISRRIVEQMEGEIGFESNPGQGSLFWFWLPLVAAEPVLPAAERSTAASQPGGRPKRILLAEDDPVNQLVTVRQLEAFGYQVEAVGTGLEALEALEQVPYDLVLMDCQMPELDGYETVQRIRARSGERWRLPIVALTAHAMKEDLDRCLAAGMNDYVTKPFHPETLRRTLEQWLAPPAETAEEPRLDPSRLEGLRELARLGGRDILAELVAKFGERPLLTSLREALGRGDREALKLIARQLKGSSSNLGAVRLARLCGELEEMAADAGLEACARQIAGIAEEYDRVLPELAAAGG